MTVPPVHSCAVLVPACEILPLRAAVLRAHKPVSESVYAEDEEPDTFHVAFKKDGRLLGCATGLKKCHPACPEAIYQLRGMAVHPDHQRQGIGEAVLRCFENEARRRGAPAIWCNARKTAEAFYARCGWKATGPVFEEVGLPHVVMTKPIIGEQPIKKRETEGSNPSALRVSASS